jgi:DnaJ-class molecular chaperone
LRSDLYRIEEIEIKDTCAECAGRGVSSQTKYACQACGGHGVVVVNLRDKILSMIREELAAHLQRTGQTEVKPAELPPINDDQVW